MTAALEGGLIGYFQWRVLRRLFPTMTSGPWVGATMIAAASGCVLSWLPTSFALTAALAARIGDLTPGPGVVIRVCLVTGALVGLVWGVAQYAVLRLHAHRAGSWIVASTMSWTISFICLYFAAFWPDRTVSPLIHVGLAALCGTDSRICVRAACRDVSSPGFTRGSWSRLTRGRIGSDQRCETCRSIP